MWREINLYCLFSSFLLLLSLFFNPRKWPTSVYNVCLWYQLLSLSFCRSTIFRLNFEATFGVLFLAVFSIILNQLVLTILPCNAYSRHDFGNNIIGYYDCPTTTLRTNMGSTNFEDEINVGSLTPQTSIIYTLSSISIVSK